MGRYRRDSHNRRRHDSGRFPRGPSRDDRHRDRHHGAYQNGRSWRGAYNGPPDPRSHHPRRDDGFGHTNPNDLRSVLDRRGSRTDRGRSRSWNGPQTDYTRYPPKPRTISEGVKYSYTKLKNLQQKSGNELLIELNSNTKFVDLLKEEKRPDWIALMVNLLYKCSKITVADMPDVWNSLFKKVFDSGFTIRLKNALILMSREKKDSVEYRDLIKSTLLLFERLMVTVPGQAHDYILACHLVLEQQVTNVSNVSVVDDEMRDSIKRLRSQVDEYVTRIARGAVNDEADDQSPPENFRQLPSVPRHDDIKHAPSFLRENKVVGAFKSVEQYLDIQYRLLREDFIQPLRVAVEEYREFTETEKTPRNAFSYENVRIIRPECSTTGIAYILQLDRHCTKKFRFSSKRLIYGTLVCLSADNFNTIIFAVVQDKWGGTMPQNGRERGVKLEVGQILVNIPDVPESETMTTCCFGVTYTMLETTSSYFGSYRHVLDGLKELEKDTFPFTDHIVTCSNHVDAPEYLKQREYEGEVVKFNFTSLLPPSASIDFKEVPALHIDQWPSADELGLDRSQHDALANAITKRLSIIQGPPGTGKTFIGLKVAKLLLDNYKIWTRDDKIQPILVVCYTNHALDQFLEGILTFVANHDIVRIGGRSNSDKLDPCLLKNLRREKRSSVTRSVWRALKDVEEQLETLQRNYILPLSRETGRASRRIMHGTQLQPYMTASQLNCLIDYGSGSDHIQRWLECEKLIDEAKHRTRMSQEKISHVDHETDSEDELQRDRYYEDDWDNFSPYKIAKELVDDHDDDEITKGLSRDQKSILADMIQERLNDPRGGMPEEQAEGIEDPWSLTPTARWDLYRYWVKRFLEDKTKEMRQHHEQFTSLIHQRTDIANERDACLMRKAKVIGMTTTGAAQHRRILTKIKPKIVMVEEAAEVLEAHIITAVSVNCEHLIMIGDHQQLRPKVSVDELVKKYRLDVSLFERMINNKFPYECLQLQHRMRPEISKLMRYWYPTLEDAESVKYYDVIRGVSTNMFFVDHGIPEDSDPERRSHSNRHEAAFVVHLCRYLLQQGYRQDQITVITPYTGQRNTCKEYIALNNFTKDIENVRFAVVDNFQGEENDIILLSLVRSNETGRIGFVQDINRACVAMSRAKKGFYVIGNFRTLQAKSLLWQRLENYLKKEGLIGEHLLLTCQNHMNDDGTKVSQASDFNKVSEGGCWKPCEYRLDCGHTCPSRCHVFDAEHVWTNQNCPGPCVKPPKCGNANHTCRKRCMDDCGRCKYPVEKNLPVCGHPQTVECEENILEVKCKQPCPKLHPCEHKCRSGCSRECEKECTTTVEKQLECGHPKRVACSKQDLRQEICFVPCTAILECGHKCIGNCSKCYRGHLHVPCTKRIHTQMECGHETSLSCAYPVCTEPCLSRCPHSRCPRKCYQPCAPCKERCPWNGCEHQKCTNLCGEWCERRRCNEPCKFPVPETVIPGRKRKYCQHQCIGVCGERCPEICKICDPKRFEMKVINDGETHPIGYVELKGCGHLIAVDYLDRYMDTHRFSTDGKPKCPKCKAVIDYHVRYGNKFKTEIDNMNAKKLKHLGDKEATIAEVIDLLQTVPMQRVNLLETHLIHSDDLSAYDACRERLYDLFGYICEYTKRCERVEMSTMYFKATQVTRIVALLNELLKVTRLASDNMKSVDHCFSNEQFLQEIIALVQYLHHHRATLSRVEKTYPPKEAILTTQQKDDVLWFMERLQCFLYHMRIQHKIPISNNGGSPTTAPSPTHTTSDTTNNTRSVELIRTTSADSLRKCKQLLCRNIPFRLRELSEFQARSRDVYNEYHIQWPDPQKYVDYVDNSVFARLKGVIAQRRACASSGDVGITSNIKISIHNDAMMDSSNDININSADNVDIACHIDEVVEIRSGNVGEIDSDPDVQIGSDPDVQNGLDPDVQIGSDPGVQIGLHPDVQIGSDPGVQIGSDPDVQIELDPDVHIGSDPGDKLGLAPDDGISSSPDALVPGCRFDTAQDAQFSSALSSEIGSALRDWLSEGETDSAAGVKIGSTPNAPNVKIGSPPNVENVSAPGAPNVEIGSAPNAPNVEIGSAPDAPNVEIGSAPNAPIVEIGSALNAPIVEIGSALNIEIGSSPNVEIGSSPNVEIGSSPNARNVEIGSALDIADSDFQMESDPEDDIDVSRCYDIGSTPENETGLTNRETDVGHEVDSLANTDTDDIIQQLDLMLE